MRDSCLPPDLPYLTVRLVVLVATFGLSGFFSGTETALFCFQAGELRRMREGDSLDRTVAHLRSRPKRLLITVLFGNMMVNVGFYSVSYLLVRQLGSRLPPSALVLASVCSLFAVIIGGEVVPKSLAVSFYRPFGRFAAIPIAVLERLLVPIVVPLERLADFVASLAGSGSGFSVRSEELAMLVSVGAREGVLNDGAERMISEVLDFSQVSLSELMLPRAEMPTFDIHAPDAELRRLLRESRLPSVPVCDGQVDNILGVVSAKDVLLKGHGESVAELVQPVPFLPETTSAEEALRRCREEGVRSLVAVDEYGAVVGLVTVEDLAEEIVGEIAGQDEPDAGPPVELLEDGSFRVQGRLSLRTWEELFEVEPPDADVETVGGMVMALLGKVLEAGDHVVYQDVEFTVESMRGRRAHTVLMRLLSRPQVQGAPDD